MVSIHFGNQSKPIEKFSDLVWTAAGEPRAVVGLNQLETLWFNTGTLCNITCVNCYIESSPKNDRLAYLTLSDVRGYLDEASAFDQPVSLIGFTGGEPFMNPHFPGILEETLSRGFTTLTLTNAMKPMWLHRAKLAALIEAYGARIRIRVSLDDWRADVHDAERGPGSFEKTMEGVRWLANTGIALEIAGRFLAENDETVLRAGYARLFAAEGVKVDCADPQALVLMPEMSPDANPPEITEACWSILNKSPHDIMCSNARMVVKRRGDDAPTVLACTLLPYDDRFDMGRTLAKASRPVPLAHPHCATFCVLGGGSCGSARSESARGSLSDAAGLS